MPLSAALISACVPENVIVASVVPSPAVKVRPVVPLKVSLPADTDSVSVR